MKKINKYKLYNKPVSLSRYPNRILKFKRPKWLRLKSQIELSSTFNHARSFAIYDLLSSKVNDGVWDKISKHHKKKLFANLIFKLQFKTKISKISSSNNLYNTRNLLLYKYFRSYYQSAVILHFLDYYTSKIESGQKIHFGNLNLNNSLSRVNNFLKKGDVLSVSDSRIILTENLQKYSSDSSFLTFLEVDDYSQTVVLVKGLEDLTSDDFYLINSEYINLNNLI
jgi:hypothetical protein